MKKIILTLTLLLVPINSFSGVSELGLSYSNVNSEINESNYTKRESMTVSYSYYLGSSTALETSYTSAKYIGSSGADVSTAEISTVTYTILGLDFVYGFSDRNAQFQPFVKLGGHHIDKKFYTETQNSARQQTASVCGIAPSAGVGFKIKMTQTFSFKLSIDGSTQPLTNQCDDDPNDDEFQNIDYAAKAGISWFF